MQLKRWKHLYEKEEMGKALAFRLRFRGTLAEGRVLSQCAKERGTFVSPARAVPQASAPSTPSLVLEVKEFFMYTQLKMWKCVILCTSCLL